MGSVIAIQDGQAEVQNGNVSTWYPLNILRIYQPENNSNSNVNMTGGRRRRQTRRRKSKKRRYSRR